MNRWVKVALALSLALNLVLVVTAGWYVAKVGARPVAEAVGVIEPRRPDFQHLAQYRYSGLPSADVVVLGDSQAEYGPWSELLGEPVSNRGLYGAEIAEVNATLDRTLTGDPEVVLIWVGTNDSFNGRSPEQVETDMRNLLAEVKTRAPEARLLVLSIPLAKWQRENVGPSNEAARQAVVASGAEWIDITEATDGMWVDGLHVSGEAYAIIADMLRARLMGG